MYLPLKIVQDEKFGFNKLMEIMKDNLTEEEKRHKIINDIFFDDELLEDDEYVDFIFGGDLFNPNYQGKFKNKQKALFSNELLLGILFPKGIPKDTRKITREMLDFCGMPIVIKKWEKTKKVYKVDKDFFYELQRTTGVTKIPMKDLERLPIKIFYVDLEDVRLKYIKGGFVYVHTNEKSVNVEVILAAAIEGVKGKDGRITNSDDIVYFSFGDGVKIKNPDAFLTFDKEGKMEEFAPVVTYYDDYQKIEYLEEKTLNRAEVASAIYKIISFLIAENKDIKESKVTKQTYKPIKNKVVKNKFSEVQMFDVGVYYGKAIRMAKEEMKKEVEAERKASKEQIIDKEIIDKEVTNEETTNEEKVRKAGKPKRPHIRMAHWHRYRTGVGRTDVITRWIPPTFVCGNKKIKPELSVSIQELLPPKKEKGKKTNDAIEEEITDKEDIDLD
ncbi:MAG: hypothetical protein K6D02_01910 [Lachnospiraceae bacterium]|nr:hypothetical protein [Lachnospiraceae bacterium]